MSRLHDLFTRLAALFGRRRMDHELAEEVRFHLDMEAAKYRRRGMDPEAARRAALVSFGGAARACEDSREARGVRPLEDLGRDLRLGLRSLRRAPAFTAVAVATLALGLGAASAMFSVVHAVLVEPLPYADPERLVRLWETSPEGSRENVVSRGNYLDWRDRGRSFSAIAAFMADFGYGLTGEGDPLQVVGSRVTPSLFPTLGVEAARGRVFLPEEGEEGRDAVALLSDGLWRRRYGADPEVVGRTLVLDGTPLTVVGVIPPGFDFPTPQTELWLPLTFHAEARSDRKAHMLQVVARLAPGVTAASAQAEMDRLVDAIREEWPQFMSGYGAAVVPLHAQVVGEARPAILILFAAVGLLLVIACVNVASLLLARGVARRSEMALRTSLGAPRGRLLRQLVTETLLLTLIGGTAGLGVAFAGVELLRVTGPADLPRLAEISLDAPVFAFTLAVALAVGLALGALPALSSSRGALRSALSGEGGVLGLPGRERARRLLTAGQIALALVLLAGAALLGRSFLRLQAVDHGFEPEKLWAVSLNLPAERYPDTPEHVAFYRQLLERVAVLPGVHATAATSESPLVGFNMTRGFDLEGRLARVESERPQTPYRVVTPGYFRVSGIPLLAGRPLTPADDAAAPPVLVVNESFARRYFPGGPALGGRISFEGEQGPWHEVVGVVGDTRHDGLAAPVAPAVYAPHAQKNWWWLTWMTLVVRTDGEVAGLGEAIHQAVWSLDGDLPVLSVRPVADLYAESNARRRFQALLMALFAAVALLLGSVGIYGVTAYGVARRTREIGLRMALGARPENVAAQVLAQGARLAAGGIAAGTAMALAAARLLEGLLFGVAPTDPPTYVAVALLLATVALAAAWLPARCAARIDPVRALKT